MNSKTSHIGDLAEIRFLLNASEKGYIISKPYGNERYDFILDTGNKLKRVQIKSAHKSTNTTNGKKYVSYAVDLTTGYSLHEADILAVYLIDDAVWYLIPTKELLSVKGITRITHNKKVNKYSKYQESWELLNA